MTFSETVNGITSTSIVVHRLVGNGDVFTSTEVTPGTWACRNGSAAVVNCETGRVRTARFTPTHPLAASSDYSVVLNPEFSLGVTDLAGNPFRRDEQYFQTAP